MSNEINLKLDKTLYDAAIAENKRLKEIISYLPKVPTQPYEKELAAKYLEIRLALIALLNDTEHINHNCSDSYCPVRDAKDILMRFNQSKNQPDENFPLHEEWEALVKESP